ncbi:MAG TPA: hypothetical protein GX733_02490 [Tissierellia bacterium]|nr:hypothetical protein [Tissierellia bacterium]
MVDLEHYAWYAFTFQYCSSLMHLCPLTRLLKLTRLRQALMTYLGCFGLL